MTQENPDAYIVTDHYRDWPMMLVDLAAVPSDELREVLIESWQTGAEAPGSRVAQRRSGRVDSPRQAGLGTRQGTRRERNLLSRFRALVFGTVAAAFALALPAVAAAEPGTFGSAGEFQVGNTGYDLAVGDFDGDDTLDVAVPNANGSNVSVLLGDGDGTFTEADESPIATNGSPLGADTGDLDGDGDDDLVVTEGATSTLRVLLSDGDGTFTVAGTPVPTGADPREVVIGKFTNDAFLDAAVVNADYDESAGSVTVLLGNGTGALTAAASSPEAAGDNASNLAAGDFNADGKEDLAVSNTGGDTVSILLGSDSGDFASPAAPTVASGGGPDGIAAAPLDSTAGTDLAVVNVFADNTSVLLGNNLGAFAAAPSSPEVQGDNDVTAADFDGDDDVDLATPEGDNISVAILLNDGSADFSLSPQGPVSSLGLVARVAAADLDNDGDQDLLVGGGNGGYYAVTSLLNDEPDEDGDGFLDTADECPTVDGTILGCPIHYRTLTLEYKRRAEVFKGVVTAEDPSCVGPGRKVRIIRSRDSGEVVEAKARTDADGRYKVEEKVKRGRFSARIRRSIDPILGICESIFTNQIVVKP